MKSSNEVSIISEKTLGRNEVQLVENESNDNAMLCVI
jgi:hypothetical protein